MEKHCVSLEIAKELKEAGWNKETEFWWVPPCDVSIEVTKICAWNLEYAEDGLNNGRGIPAPLATEILEELPISTDIHKTLKGYRIARCVKDDVVFQLDLTLPNALAKMWLYLKKEKLL